ncbi:DUF4230 domain-containing protein [Polymorphobacter sp.]|uniref:DUF4230 domain-containing protein n=1 Tax=Polymorphobacter sp. TaxID=1909290 RepID=UPI003F6FB180
MIRVLLGLAIGAGLVIAGLNFASDRLPAWLGGREAPLSIAATSLESVQRQSRLIVLTARFNSVITSRSERLGGLVSASKTLIIPGTIRYELDLSTLKVETMRWDVPTRTLTIHAPRPQPAGPEVDLPAAREFSNGALLMALTNVESRLDAANRAAVAADMRAQAQAPAIARLADEAARDAVQRMFLLPLVAAGYDDARVKVTFAGFAPTSAATSPTQE